MEEITIMKKSMSFKILLLSFVTMFLMSAPLANAQNEEVNGTVETILENIQEHNLREDDVLEELKGLTVNELENVDEYLSSKPDITMNENQILTLTQELLSNGNSVNYVIQENLNTAKRKEELRSEAQESAENLSDEEREILMNELQSNMDKSIEEEVMYEELLNIADKEVVTTILLLGIGTAIFGAFVYAALNKDEFSSSFSFAGIMLFAFGLGVTAISLYTLYTS